MSSDFIKVLTENIIIVIIAGLIVALVGVIIGYLIGNTSLRGEVERKLNEEKKSGLVQRQIIDNVGLGVIVYYKSFIIYANKTIEQLPGFLKGDIPGDMQSFLNCYDKDNQLKSSYLLGLQNGVNTTRANYFTSGRIYEIKILRKTSKIGEGQMEIVIIEDITQIKDDEKRQKDLAANVSHELKTPLTVIKASEVFFRNASPDNMPTYDDFIRWGERIVLNCNRMQDIVEDFLVLSMTSTTNKMGIFDIEDCVTKAISNISDYKGRDKVDLRFVKSSEYPPLLFGNGKLVMRLIINLLTNAVKYIGYDGKTAPDTIKVSILTIDERIAVQVEDNGRGIPNKDLSHLFERFYRVDNSGSRDVGGSGIGLAIAKEIADMHDGSIAVNSTVGIGSTFTFVMPIASTIFESTRDDGKAGIISDKPFYRAAALFLGSQICEVARSMGYDDMEPLISDYENTPDIEKAEKDKKLAMLIKGMSEERFADLLDELLYIDTEMDDLDDLSEEETAVPLIEDIEEEETNQAPAQAPEITEEPEPPVQIITSDADMIEVEPVTIDVNPVHIPVSAAVKEEVNTSEELEIMRQKEEARKILTQTILPRSAQFKAQESHAPANPVNENTVTNTASAKVIHPEMPKKEYNTETKKRTGKRDSLFGGLQHVNEDKKTEVRSSLKMILDENDTRSSGKK
ncbi:MAG: hypothetical protein K6A80_07375 [Saccharofermentans sp.]|nr:hypothetical protein [Saccharofermentans sp.]